MNKKKINLVISSAFASGLMCSLPALQAGENPFAISEISPAQQIAEGAEGMSTPMPEGKCGATKAAEPMAKDAAEGKCGAKKSEEPMTKDAAVEGKCGSNKAMTEGKCGAKKTKKKTKKKSPAEGKCGAKKKK